MSEDAFEPSFPSLDDDYDEFPYLSQDDDVPLNLELSSAPNYQKPNVNVRSSGTGVLRFQDDDEDPLLDLNDDDDDPLLQLENTLMYGSSKPNILARGFARFPWIMGLLALALAGGCTYASIEKYDFFGILDFDDPTAGFEARGTDISSKTKSMLRLYYTGREDTATPEHPQGNKFSFKPNVTLITSKLGIQGIPSRYREPPVDSDPIEPKEPLDTKNISPPNDNMSKDGIIHNRRIKRSGESFSTEYNISECLTFNSLIFMENNNQNSMQLAFQSKHGDSLFNAAAMHSMCRFEDELIQPYMPSDQDAPRCRSASLAFYVTALSGHDSCYDITNQDMEKFKGILTRCYPYYANDSMHWSNPNIETLARQNEICFRHKALYNIFYYLTDTGFMSGEKHVPSKLTYTSMIVTSYALAEEQVEEYFKKVIQKDTTIGSLKLVGFFFNNDIKFDMFNDYLMDDIWLFGLAMGIILFIMFLYLLSLTLVVATLFNVAMSFMTAFCLYHLIFGIKFFPFINLLAGLILIAIGADDVFIFYDTWDQMKKIDRGIPLEFLVSKTFGHAALSIFVTSLTTSAAFFANSVSSITAIKCFGIFAGLAVLANFFFMVTWTPAVIICIEKYKKWSLKTGFFMSGLCIISGSTMFFTRLIDFLLEIFCNMCTIRERLHRACCYVFNKFLPKVIAKLHIVLIGVFLIVGIGGLISVFYKPKLKLPHSKNFQLFPNSHPMERWDRGISMEFQYNVDADEKSAEDITLYFVWGIEHKDNGNLFDPRSRAHLITDTNFNMTAAESQQWMKDFCQDLVHQPFIHPKYAEHNLSYPCIYNYFDTLLNEACHSPPTDTSAQILRPCCYNITKGFPVDSSTFETCLPMLAGASLLYKKRTTGTVVFNKKDNLPSAFLVIIDTNHHFTPDYEDMHYFIEQIQTYFDGWLRKAPSGLRNGWFTGRNPFIFYDLQRAIATGTYYSIVLSLAVAFVVMLLTSLNVLITAYALFTITLAIAATIASLVFMGWELNIIESITISLAVGLSIDFTIHYGVAYRLSKEKYSHFRVQESFQRVGPAVVMAALTTFLAGSAMMPSHILGYQELGLFLMLVMTFSWFFATFFFQSVCHLIGPKGNFCQISFPCFKKNNTNNDTEMEHHSSNTLMLRSDSEDSLLVTF